MHDMLAEPAKVEAAGEAESAAGAAVRLSVARPGDRGVIVDVRAESHVSGHGVDVQELQRRLLEFGFVEGARIEVLHEGAIWRDPIAVRLDDMRIGLRRRDAEDVWILLDAR
ncbi:MAG TPA: FeoA family protein [Phenylobacterium sp.]|jgi:ferrous iron transport protein A|uniref:FeoA family protein n=1 Tax=Phenylobacterium sp. TaxID=1871053 RepID=UPI002D38FF96|nr:FeoA family protein [Phenylobacterium sp.]HZZ67647.1 FeoA family protein [Phenylobacterium sp.]